MFTIKNKPFAWAKFGDTKVEVPGITAEAWTSRARTSRSGHLRHNLFYECEKDGAMITVSKKKDHCLLVVMYSKTGAEKQRQLCMMTVKSWGAEDSALVKKMYRPLTKAPYHN